MIVFSAFIQSEYRGTRHHFSILLVSFSVLKNKQIQVNDSWLLPSTTESLFLKYWTESGEGGLTGLTNAKNGKQAVSSILHQSI